MTDHQDSQGAELDGLGKGSSHHLSHQPLSATGLCPAGLEDWKGEMSYLGYSTSAMYVVINCLDTREVTSKPAQKVNSQRK